MSERRKIGCGLHEKILKRENLEKEEKNICEICQATVEVSYKKILKKV